MSSRSAERPGQPPRWWSRLARLWRPGRIKSFREEQAGAGAYEHRNLGLCTVKLRQIVGSVGRYRDFDRKFRLRKNRPRERLQTITELMSRGRPLPPVDLYRIGDEYFVLDGNHRIAAAKRFGFEDINARVVEFLPSAGSPQSVLRKERTEFLRKTGLPDLIGLTETGQYAHLLEQILRHQRHLSDADGRAVPFEQAAADWHRTIYTPMVSIIRAAGLPAHFPDRTADDLYAYISYHRWEKERPVCYGSALEPAIPTNMEEFRNKMLHDQPQQGYPEMLREITVFVLLNVATRREDSIVEDLFAMDEVRELHTVHGNIDIILKVVLERDLLASDAQTVSRFVQEKIRRVEGIISSQTLLPGLSRIKSEGETR